MQSRRPNRRATALAVAVTLLLTTPVLAAPAAAGEASWSGIPGWEALWNLVTDAFGAWIRGDADVNARSIGGVAPVSVDRIIEANGAGVDPNGSPEPTTSWPGDATADTPSSTSKGRSGG